MLSRAWIEWYLAESNIRNTAANRQWARAQVRRVLGWHKGSRA